MLQGLLVDALPDPAAPAFELVERKGLGHPDTICDALAEEASRALCRWYLDRFGFILHHNLDKILLVGGAARPAFGGGAIDAPIEIMIAGRATRQYRGVDIPVADIVVETCQKWLGRHLRWLDASRDVRIRPLIRAGSAGLVALFERARRAGGALANDTSIGVGFAPLSPLERTVLVVDAALSAPAATAANPAFGEDIKVLGMRRGSDIEMSIAIAMVGRHLRDMTDYESARQRAAKLARAAATSTGVDVSSLVVNAADDPGRNEIYLTVAGTSAESGDDGETGRGNRVNGLITPSRPMAMEAAAGKNPVSHVGKLYNVLAREIAETVVREVAGISAAECHLASRIGSPVKAPALIGLRLYVPGDAGAAKHVDAVTEIVATKLDELDVLTRRFVDEDIGVY